jgi:N-acyl-D-amino-acid deacylase
MDAMDAHGGWIARAADLVRYAHAIDGFRGEALLEPATLETMVTEPHAPFTGPSGARNTDPAAKRGWAVQDGPLGREWAHTGALGGSNSSLLLQKDAGLTLAFVAYTLPADFFGFLAALRPALLDAAMAMRTWPDHDLAARG